MTLLPLSDSQRRWLKDALNQWQTNRTISAEQAQKILEGYEPEEAVELRKNSRLVFVLGGMAVLLFGAAILLVVGHNWQEIPRAGKLVVNLGLIGLAHFAAWFFRAKRNDLGLSNILHFLGCLLYGVAIWTIAQAYHISGHYPDGMWWWAIGVLPFVIFGDSLIFQLLYALLLYIWMTMELTGFGSHHFLNRLFWGWVSLPKGTISLPILVAPGLIWAYRKSSAWALSFYLALLGGWCLLWLFTGFQNSIVIFWIGSLGSVYLLLSEVHPSRSSMAIPFRFWGALMVVGALLPLGSAEIWNEIARDIDIPNRWWYSEDVSSRVQSNLMLTSTVLFLLATVLVVLVARALSQCRLTGSENVSQLGKKLLFPILFALTFIGCTYATLLLTSGVNAISFVPMLWCNLVTLGMVVYLLRVGVHDERMRPFSCGIVLFLIWAFWRYIDLFSSTFGMLGAAGLFALCGIAFVVMAKFWRKTSSARKARKEEVAFQTLTMPAWLSNFIDLGAKQWSKLVAAAVALQLLFLLGMIGLNAMPYYTGQRIVLKCEPIDPRDLMRGEYVILNFDIHRLAREKVSGNKHAGQVVFVSLQKKASNQSPSAPQEVWEATEVSFERPAQGVYIRGTVSDDYMQPVSFGVENYFVQEGKGKTFESYSSWLGQNEGKQLYAEICLTNRGIAKLSELIPVDAEPTKLE